MAFQVILTEPALIDLEDVMSWSFDQHPETSERFGAALLNHIELLGSFPALGVPIQGSPDVRRLVHFPLHVYYRVNDRRGAVEVLRVRHAARDRLRF
jgi:plasmid stabilization system protein ParE